MLTFNVKKEVALARWMSRTMKSGGGKIVFNGNGKARREKFHKSSEINRFMLFFSENFSFLSSVDIKKKGEILQDGFVL